MFDVTASSSISSEQRYHSEKCRMKDANKANATATCKTAFRVNTAWASLQDDSKPLGGFQKQLVLRYLCSSKRCDKQGRKSGQEEGDVGTAEDVSPARALVPTPVAKPVRVCPTDLTVKHPTFQRSPCPRITIEHTRNHKVAQYGRRKQQSQCRRDASLAHRTPGIPREASSNASRCPRPQE